MSPNHNTFTVVHLGKKNWSLRHQESLGGTFSHNQCITATLSVLPLYLSSKPSSHLPTLISNFDWLLNYNSFSSCLDYTNTHEDQTTCKEITPWKCRQKNSLMPSCRPVYLQPLPSKKFIRQCTVTHRGHVLPAPYKHTFKELITSSDTTPDTFIAPFNGHPTCRRGTSAVGDDKVVCKGANLVSRHWQKANYGSRRVPTLPSSNQHKTTGAI